MRARTRGRNIDMLSLISHFCMLVEIITTLIFGILSMSLLLRKVVLSTSALQNNAVSFVNQTARTLHIRKIRMSGFAESTAGTLGDSATASLDEVPIAQNIVNDSRSHIQACQAQVAGGTGSVEATFDNSQQGFGRSDLMLEPDEALFLNTTDISGALDVTFSANIWYET